MPDGNKLAVWSNERAITYVHFGAIQDCDVEIDVRTFAAHHFSMLVADVRDGMISLVHHTIVPCQRP